MTDITLGDSSLSAWRPFPGMIWVQTREPKLARKLADRQDSKLIVYNYCSPYLRIFAFEGKTMAWADRLIKRYRAALSGTGEGKTSLNRPESAELDSDALPPHQDEAFPEIPPKSFSNDL